MSKNPHLSAVPAGGIKFCKIVAAMTSLLIVSFSLCQAAQTITLAWNTSSDSSIAGYKLRYGTTSGALNQVVDVGKTTTKTVSNLNDGTTYFFTVTAYNTGGIESAPSNQVSYTTNAPPSGGHVLTVMSGSGDGNYAIGTKVPVSANAPPAGQQFDRWARDYQILADPSDSTTIATMPSLDATIEATYKLRTISIWPNTAVPRVADGGPDKPVELGVKFRSDVAGEIIGIRFYKAATNTGEHVGNLWTSTGTLLATATFTGETGSGWQQVIFATPVPIAANTVYVASYHADSGHYSADVNSFSVSVDNPPLHALPSSSSNGVYAYGANSLFPNQAWNSCNYWVDVVFKY